MPVPAIIGAIIVIIISGFVIIKNSNFNQPQPTADKGFQANINYQEEAFPSSSLKPSSKPTPKYSSTPKPSTFASSTPQASQSSTSNNSNNSASGNTNNSNTQSASAAPTATIAPTPTPTAASCSGLCFDRSSASVEVTEGTNVESGGSTASAFNLLGDGSHGYLMNSSGLPAGISIWPSSGAFGESTFPVKIWITTNGNVPYGTYSGTVILKQGQSGGAYTEVGTISITVTYKKI